MSLRNNSERLGAHPTSEAPAPAFAENQFSFVLPTMFVELPSKGEFYLEGHPLHGLDAVEIRMMTAKDEDLLTNPDLIKKKVVLDRLIQSLLVDKRLRVDDLLVGDKNAILLNARVAGYGSDYEVEITCPSCGAKEKKEYDIEECLQTKESEELEEAQKTERGTFLVQLPLVKYTCEVKLLTGKEEKKILKNFDFNSKKKKNTTLTDQLKETIVALNGDEDKKKIEFFVDHMPASDARFLRKVYDKLAPDVQMATEFECRECEHLEVIEVPLTVDFFWPK